MKMECALKKNILEIVKDKNGLKTTELVVELIAKHHISIRPYLSPQIIFKCIDELIEKRKLISIKYTLAHLCYREKEFLLPRDTEITSISSFGPQK